MGWGDYWRDVCAPVLMARKKELGRAVPEREIAAAVEAATGKPSGRGLVSLWLLGKREPFISQFFALCKKLDIDPYDVLKRERAHTTVEPIFRRSDVRRRRITADQKKKLRGTPG